MTVGEGREEPRPKKRVGLLQDRRVSLRREGGLLNDLMYF